MTLRMQRMVSGGGLLKNISKDVTLHGVIRNLSSIPKYDLVVVGGGIVGTATARELSLRYPNLKMAIVEKEQTLGSHQTGHNSGVIHAGIYYQPDSLKAKLCVQGMNLAYQYCNEQNIPYKKCGKLIVAVDDSELSALENLHKRGLANGVKDMKMVDAKGIKEIEPHCRGVRALWSPHTGIVDWGAVNSSFGEDFRKAKGCIYLNFCVSSLKLTNEDSVYPLLVKSENHTIACKYLVTCGGLHSDRLSEMSGCSPEPRIVPFRGEYLLLSPKKSNLVRGNIYPVPNPKFPFLGVHFTPRIDGSVWLGPNAVLAFKKEGYSITDVSFSEMCQVLKYRGLQQLASRHLMYGLKEMYMGINISAQVKQLQRFVPELKREDVTRGPAGVRAQALDRDGNLVDDFVFDQGKGEMSKRILHVRNAPSPGATSSLAIALMIADKVTDAFHLQPPL